VSRSPRLRLQPLIHAATVALLVASTSHAQQAVQWRVQDGGNGHWYACVEESRTWSEQADFGSTLGAHLVTLADPAENSFVHAQFPGRAWLGGFAEPGQGCVESAWKWVTGEPWTHAPWAPPEPNYCDETRLEFSGPYPARWNNYHGQVPNRAIIEWSADCNGDGIVDYGQILSGEFQDANRNGIPDRVCECLGDIDADGTVAGADLSLVLAAWGTAAAGADADLNADGAVDGFDLAFLLAGWGPCAVATPAWATLVEAAPDPGVVTDPALRAAISATGLPWRVRDTATQIEMLLVPPSSFVMGCSPSQAIGCEAAELPVHSVSLTEPFYLGRYEVTQSQWTERMGSNPSTFQGSSREVPAEQVAGRPVEQVSWDTVQQFLALTGMRLPSEAEWEYAYRAGSAAAYHGVPGDPSGFDDDALLGTIAWFSGNSEGQTRPVGQKFGNGLGFHDMSGNVWEWVNDWFSAGYYAESPAADPPGPATGGYRVLRGGSFIADAGGIGCRSSSRLPWGIAVWNVGFRVARSP
jgi:formylglycine-generating enzyme required for sulfatase activity